jgi:hypothetical protein
LTIELVVEGSFSSTFESLVEGSPFPKCFSSQALGMTTAAFFLPNVLCGLLYIE